MTRANRKRLASLTRAAVVAAGGVAGVFSAQPATATDLYWDINGQAANSGTTASGTWDESGRWNTDDTGGAGGTTVGATSSLDQVFFSSGTTHTLGGAVTLGAAAEVSGVTFQQGNITLSGAALTIGAGGLTYLNGTGANILSAPLRLATASSINHEDNSAQSITGGIAGNHNLDININSTGGLAISGGQFDIGGRVRLAGTGTGLMTITSQLSSSVDGVVVDASRLTLNADNNASGFTGGLTVNGGTLHGANTSTSSTFHAFGSGVVNLNGGTVLYRADGTSNDATVNANAVVVGSNGGTIDVNRTGGSRTGVTIALASLTIGSGALTVAGGNSYRLRVVGTTTLTDHATFSPTSASLTLAGEIADGASDFNLTKTGSGTLSLLGTNTYSGVTSILAGTLTVNTAAPSGAAGALGNATSDVLLGHTIGSSDAVLQNSVAGGTGIARNITVQSGNTGVVTLQGSTSGAVVSGTITLGSANSAGHGLVLNSTSGTFSVTSDIHDSDTMTAGTAGGITINGGTIAMSGDQSDFTGGVVLNGGRLEARHANALGVGTLTVNGGVLGSYPFGSGNPEVTISNAMVWSGDFTSGISAGKALHMLGNVTLVGSRVLTTENNSGFIVRGVISDSVEGANNSLTFRTSAGSSAAGRWTLANNNTFGGGVVIVGNASHGAIVTASGETALGTGQVRLASRTTSQLNLGTLVSVESLSTAISAPVVSLSAGLPNGIQNLVFTGGGGTGASGTATISNNTISSIAITSYGQNYTSAPTVTLENYGSGDATITSVYQASVVDVGAHKLTILGTNATPAHYGGVISGATGSLVKAGAGVQRLGGVNTYGGATTVSGGVLNILGTGSINSTSGIAIDGAGATLQYDSSVALTKAVTFGSNGGTFLYNENAVGYGGGTLTLGTGATLGGSGRVGDVDTSAGGTISPGNSAGILTVDGNLTVGTGTVAIELAKSGETPTAGTDYDQLLLSSTTATIDLSQANLSLSLGSGLEDGDIFYIISNSNTGGGATGTTGPFATLGGQVTPGLNGTGTFLYGGMELAISYTADADSEEFSNAGNDVAIQAISVPEPASLSLLAVGAACLLSRRRRRVH